VLHRGTLGTGTRVANLSFELNGKEMSTLNMGALSWPAFSGMGRHRNERTSQCIMNNGPIPVGTYYIFDRESGGPLSTILTMLNGRGDWFSLYAKDGVIDDHVICNHVVRGNFRIHPKGELGISLGCITLENWTDFQILKRTLKTSPKFPIRGSELLTYGTLVVS